MKLPQCITTYDKTDTVCNGDPHSKSEGDQTPCAWRDRCAALQRHLQDTGEPLAEHGRVVDVVNVDGEAANYFRANDWDVLQAKLKDLVKKYGTLAEQAAAEAADQQEDHPAASEEAGGGSPNRKGKMPDGRRSLKPGRKARALARRTLMRAARERHKVLLEAFRKFRASLAEALPEYNWAGDHDAVAPGRLYVKDRLDTSGYASVYCKTASGRDIPLASCRFKPRDLQMEISLPIEPGEATPAAVKKLDLKPLSDGRFKSKTKKLDGASLGLAVELIAKAVREEKINLPAARRPYGWRP